MNQPNQTRSMPQVAQAQAYQPGPPQHPQLAGMQAAPIPRQKQFWVSFRSQMDGQLYEGQFTTRKLSIKDLAAIGVRKVQLNGGYHYDEDKPGVGVDAQTDWMNSMIAHLEIALIQAPIWFKIEDMIDGNLLAEVFKQVMEFENSFFRPSGQDGANSGSQPDVSGPEGKGTGTMGSIAPMVGGKIPSALEP